MPECNHLSTTLFHHLAIWLVELCEARISRQLYLELVEISHTWMLFKKEHYPINQMSNHTENDGMKNIRYYQSHLTNSSHNPEGASGGTNRSIFQLLPCFQFLHLISLYHKYHLLKVLLIVSQLPQSCTPSTKWQVQYFTHWAMGPLDWIQVNALEVVRARLRVTCPGQGNTRFIESTYHAP